MSGWLLHFLSHLWPSYAYRAWRYASTSVGIVDFLCNILISGQVDCCFDKFTSTLNSCILCGGLCSSANEEHVPLRRRGLRLKTIKGNVQRRWSGLLLGGSIGPNYLSCISNRCVHIICIRAAATGCRIVKRNGDEGGYKSVLLLIFHLPLCRLLSHSRQLLRFRFLASRSLFCHFPFPFWQCVGL